MDGIAVFLGLVLFPLIAIGLITAFASNMKEAAEAITAAERDADAPTFRQLDYIDYLRETKRITEDWMLDDEPETKCEASALIDALLELPDL